MRGTKCYALRVFPPVFEKTEYLTDSNKALPHLCIMSKKQ